MNSIFLSIVKKGLIIKMRHNDITKGGRREGERGERVHDRIQLKK